MKTHVDFLFWTAETIIIIFGYLMLFFGKGINPIFMFIYKFYWIFILCFLSIFIAFSLIITLSESKNSYRDYPDIRRDTSQMRGDRKRIQESEEMRFWTRK